MKLYEIYRKYIREFGSIAEVIKQEYYIPRDDEFVKKAFSAGHGTKADMNRYMRDNASLCIWVNPETMQIVTSI